MRDTVYETMNAVIKSANVIRKNGFLVLHADFWRQGGYSQGLGGHILYNSNEPASPYAYETIFNFLEIARAETFQDAVGKAVRIIASKDEIKKIGHIIDNKWLELGDENA